MKLGVLSIEPCRTCIPAAVATLVVLATVGCGAGVPAGKVRVSGRVTNRGEPLAADSIVFESREGLDSCSTRADAQGNFRVVLTPGDYAVAVRKVDGDITIDGNGNFKYPPTLIPKKYGSAQTSGLSATVTRDARPIVIEIPE